MALSDREKEVLRRQLSPAEVTHRYQQAIKYFADGASTGIMDKSEYKIYQQTLPQKDLAAAAHAWFGMVLTFQEYFDLVQAIIGFDLMIQGVMDGQIKAKSNGEDKDKEVDTDDLMSLEKDEDNE